MIGKKLLSIFLVSTFTCKAGIQKEFTTPRFVHRDPFSWVAEKKKEVSIVAKRVEKKVEIKKHEMPWEVHGVSLSSEGAYALLSHRNETKIVRPQQEVCVGWKVEKITPTLVQLKHTTGEYKELIV
jgi:hypothetical protein